MPSMNLLFFTIKVTLTLVAFISFFLINKQKTINHDFYQACIVQFSNFIRLFSLIYRHTLRRIFLRSSFLFYLHVSALSNTLLTFIIFVNIKQWSIISILYIFLTIPFRYQLNIIRFHQARSL